MKLNADIVFKAICEKYSAEMHGTNNKKLLLTGPNFYMSDETIFIANHLYLASCDHLSLRPNIQKNVTIVCIGDGPRLSYYKEKCCVIIIKGKPDFFVLYSFLQGIFKSYDEWNDTLFEYFRKDAGVQKILECSVNIFQRPIAVLDANFGIIAYAQPQKTNNIWQGGQGNITQNSMKIFLDESSLALDVHGPIYFNTEFNKSLCVNLFDSSDKYIGCLFIDCASKECDSGDGEIACYLAHILEQIIEHNPSPSSNENIIKQVLKDLIEEMPVSRNKKWLLNNAELKNSYVCLSIRILASHSQMPANYICNILEFNFPQSMAFPANTSIICFVNLTALTGNNDDYHKKLNESLLPLLKDIRLYCGISNEFTDLFDARLYYTQAEIAIENGIIVNPNSNYYYFSDYVLLEMVTNSLGGLPSESYFPKSIKNILKHDENSNISYLETLKVLLDENMSFSAAAKRLFIHRSTLMDRISRMEKDMGLDIKTPDSRLLIQLLIKAMELENIIRNIRQ